jgi:hypothetical protein
MCDLQGNDISKDVDPRQKGSRATKGVQKVNPLKAELNPIYYLLALL